MFAEKVAAVLKDSCFLPSPPSSIDGNQYYTVENLCKMLHITKATYYRHKNLGLVAPSVYVGRKPLFTQQAIDNYLNNFKN